MDMMGLITTEKAALYAVGILALFSALRVFASGNRITRDGKPLRKPPNTLPIVGNGILFLQARQKLFSWFHLTERRFGYETLQLLVPTLPPGVLINDPRNLDFVFRNEGVFSKGVFVKRRSFDLFGHGIINADGELWKTQRKAGLHFLSTANLRVLTDVALPQILTNVVDGLRRRTGEVVDLQHVFHEITTQLMGKMAYNMEDMRADDEFSISFDYASGKTAERFQNPLWPFTEIFLGAKFRRAVSVVKEFGRKIVANAVKDRRQQVSVSGDIHEDDDDDDVVVCDGNSSSNSKLDQMSGSLIQSLLDAIGDEKTVADAALTYLSAGRDTTGQALTWAFYLLMRHPDVAVRIRTEVRQCLAQHGGAAAEPAQQRQGARDLDSGLGLDPAAFSPARMPYTMAVFYETLRLYPPIPFEIRQCERETALPDGTVLPRGSVLVWCVWAMNRSVHTYGADADAFRPERWLVPANTSNNSAPATTSSPPRGDGGPGWRLTTRSASEFPVFNGGPRTCLGKKMAEAVAVQVIATVAWLFDFAPEDDAERVSKSSLTLPMEGGLPAVVSVRAGV